MLDINSSFFIQPKDGNRESINRKKNGDSVDRINERDRTNSASIFELLSVPVLAKKSKRSCNTSQPQVKILINKIYYSFFNHS
jgi:hypothetical protein